MAAAIYLGLSADEFEARRPSEAREIVTRLRKHRQAEEQRRNAEVEAILDTLGNLMKGINNVVRGLEHVQEAIVKQPTVRLG